MSKSESKKEYPYINISKTDDSDDIRLTLAQLLVVLTIFHLILSILIVIYNGSFISMIPLMFLAIGWVGMKYNNMILLTIYGIIGIIITLFTIGGIGAAIYYILINWDKFEWMYSYIFLLSVIILIAIVYIMLHILSYIFAIRLVLQLKIRKNINVELGTLTPSSKINNEPNLQLLYMPAYSVKTTNPNESQ
jgi:hypothetical protein